MAEETKLLYARAHFQMGLKYHEMNMLSEAKAEYEKALQIEPDYYEVLNNLSGIYYTEGRVEDAKSLLDKAINGNPKRSLAYFNLAKICTRDGETDKAIGLLSRLIELDSKNAEALYQLGRMYFQQRSYGPAWKYFKEAYAINPDIPDLRYYMGMTLLREGFPDKAVEHLKTSAESKDAGFYVFNALGIAYYRKEMKYEAIKNFKRAISIKPDNASSHLNLAIIHCEQGDYGAAVEEYRKYLKYSPSSEKTEQVKNIIKQLEEYRVQ